MRLKSVEVLNWSTKKWYFMTAWIKRRNNISRNINYSLVFYLLVFLHFRFSFLIHLHLDKIWYEKIKEFFFKDTAYHTMILRNNEWNLFYKKGLKPILMFLWNTFFWNRIFYPLRHKVQSKRLCFLKSDNEICWHGLLQDIFLPMLLARKCVHWNEIKRETPFIFITIFHCGNIFKTVTRDRQNF